MRGDRQGALCQQWKFPGAPRDGGKRGILSSAPVWNVKGKLTNVSINFSKNSPVPVGESISRIPFNDIAALCSRVTAFS